MANGGVEGLGGLPVAPSSVSTGGGVRPGTDPSISLHIASPNVGQANPLGMVGQYAEIQNRLNQARLFNAQFSARQQLGEIMATSPDPETGYQRMMASPASAFFPEMLTQNREAMLAMTRQRQVEQEMGGSALTGFMHLLPALASSPTQATWDHLVQAQLATMPPGPVRDRVAKGFQSIGASLVGDLPTDPAQAGTQFQARLAGVLTSANVSADSLRYLFGGPDMVQQGASQIPIWRGGIVSGGGLTRTGEAIAMGAAPSYGGPEGLVPRPALGLPTGTPTGNALSPGAPAATGVAGNALGGVTTPPTTTVAQAPTGAAVTAPRVGATPDLSAQAQQITRGQELAKGDAALAKQYATDFAQTQQALPSTVHTLDMLQDALRGFPAGGWATKREQIAQWVQGFGQQFGFSTDQINRTTDAIVGNRNGLQDLQLFNSLIKPMMISELKKSTAGMRVMRP